MSSLVVYKDELNTIPLRSFNSKEMDLFFSICSKMRNNGLKEITFTFEDLKELSDYKYSAYDRFIKDIEGIYDKLIKLDIRLGSTTEFTKFVLFTKYSVSAKNETVIIKINEEFQEILNNITGNFTKFELMEFTSLNSSYSKTAYRLLKQFRTTGYYIVPINEFKRLFDIPKSYQMNDITKNILDRIEDELPEFFKGLEVNKLRGKGKKKRFIEYIEFKFEPEIDIKKGNKVFRDKETKEYYERNIMDFTDEEVEKTFPEVKPLSENISLQNKMGLPDGKFTNKQVDEIYNLAMKRILDTKSNIDVFGLVNYYWDYMKNKKVSDPVAYLKNLLNKDYDNRLGQQKMKGV